MVGVAFQRAEPLARSQIPEFEYSPFVSKDDCRDQSAKSRAFWCSFGAVFGLLLALAGEMGVDVVHDRSRAAWSRLGFISILFRAVLAMPTFSAAIS